MNECEYCGGKMKSVNSVINRKDEEVYRLKRCERCKHEIWTVEFEVEDNSAFRRTVYECVKRNRELTKHVQE